MGPGLTGVVLEGFPEVMTCRLRQVVAHCSWAGGTACMRVWGASSSAESRDRESGHALSQSGETAGPAVRLSGSGGVEVVSLCLRVPAAAPSTDKA